MKAKTGFKRTEYQKGTRGAKSRAKSPRTFLLPFSSLCYKVSLASLLFRTFLIRSDCAPVQNVRQRLLSAAVIIHQPNHISS
jgi:hypothetical protein